VAEQERIRIEIAFEGGQALSVLVAPDVADELDRALSERAEGAVAFEAEGGRYSVAVRKIVYVKRFARESRVGFGAAS